MQPLLADCPIPGAVGFADPEGSGANGVLMLGEALGEAEVQDSLPFRPYAEAGSVLERALRKLGLPRSEFVIHNAINTHPPKNFINPAWEGEAIAWGRQWVDKVITDFKPRVILALGNVALRAATGLHGEYLGVTTTRGYVLPTHWGIPCVCTLHPAFLRRKSMANFSAFMHDIKLAYAVSNRLSKFWSPVLWRDFDDYPLAPVQVFDPDIPPGFIIHPDESVAFEYLHRCEGASYVAYDIETPRSTKTSEEDTDELGETEIVSIQFSIEPGEGIYFMWREPFITISKKILALRNTKLNHNGWRFDDPLLAAHGAPVAGKIHDMRWAWKQFQPELMANLQFILSFYGGARRGIYKHLHQSHPGYYGIRDVSELQYAFARTQ